MGLERKAPVVASFHFHPGCSHLVQDHHNRRPGSSLEVLLLAEVLGRRLNWEAASDLALNIHAVVWVVRHRLLCVFVTSSIVLPNRRYSVDHL